MSLPLLMAGASIVGGAINAVETSRANKRNTENWKKQSVMNSAASQASRLRAAGLAPYSAIQQIASNNKVDLAPDQQVSQFGTMVGQAGQMYGQGSQIDSQIDLQTAQASAANAQAELASVESALKSLDLDIGYLTKDATVATIEEAANRARYEAKEALRNYLDNLRFVPRERQAQLDSVFKANAALDLDLFLRKEFGYAENLADLVYRCRLDDNITAQTQGVRYNNQLTFKQLRDYDKRFGKDYWDTYAAELMSAKRSAHRNWAENYYWETYWNAMYNDNEMNPYQQVRHDFKDWKRNRFNSAVTTWTTGGSAVLSTAVSLGTAARSFRPSTTQTQFFDSNGAITGGSYIHRF